ncbi:MAG: tryptophan--tRNA ligase [Elusimicrobiales bacterium]
MKVVVSGMRPTGRLHLGNYWGALRNFINLQNDYECYFFIADLHALTTANDMKQRISENTFLMVADWLACGLNPEKCVIFRQSDIPAHYQLHLLLSMIVPLSWLLRNPTFKEQLIEIYEKKYKGQEDKAKRSVGSIRRIAEASGMDDKTQDALLSEIANYGFLGYPVLQSADILLYDADFVPVGKDQLAHIEITRHVASRFNSIFKKEVFKQPQPLLTDTPVIPGIDGKKMSKSYGNTVDIGENGDSLKNKVMSMYTDPKKIRATDSGNPNGCVVYAFHRVYNPDYKNIELDCKAARLGCVACKKRLFEVLNPIMKGIDDKRRFYLENRDVVYDVIKSGNDRALKKSGKKFDEVLSAIGLV